MSNLFLRPTSSPLIRPYASYNLFHTIRDKKTAYLLAMAGLCLPVIASAQVNQTELEQAESNQNKSNQSEDATEETDKTVVQPAPDDGFAIEEEEESDPDVEGVEGTTIVASPAGEAPDSSHSNSKANDSEPDSATEEEDWSGGFEVEDISDDAEALEADLKEGQVQATGTVGTLSGVVLDTSGEPVAGAYIEVVGKEYVARAGIDGRYSLDLPPGPYTIVVREELHQAIKQPGLKIVANQTLKQDFKLVPQAKALVVKVEADANVEGDAGVLIQRQKKVASTDSMSRKEISRSGGGKLASVARRIVGATLIDGRFVFVRGLGHRYGNTLLDGARVPSPEPELRTVPLDIFPSGALGAINVQKSATPDVPADFAGGSLQLVTREIPNELVLSLGVELEVNSVTTGQPMLYSQPFMPQDFFAFGNLPRGLPNRIPKDQKAGRGILNPETFEPLYTEAEIEAQGEAMLTDTRVRRGRNAPVNGKFSMTIGNSWSGKQAGKFGLLASGSYSNGHQTIKEHILQYGGDGETGDLDTETPQVDFRSFKTVQSVRWNLLGLAHWDINEDHRVDFSSLYSRDADDETRELRGISSNTSGLDPLLSTRLRYIMREIWFNRLGGRHRFPIFAGKHRIQLDYFGSYSRAKRDDPAIREMLFLAEDGQCDIDQVRKACRANVDASAGSVGNQMYLDLIDHNANGTLNFKLPFDQWSGLETSIKVGAWAEGKWREFGVRRFDYQTVSGLNDRIPSGTGNIVNKDTIGGGIGPAQGGDQPFTLREQSRSVDNYRAEQELFAGYGMLTLPFTHWFRISGGARVEANTIEVKPFDPFAIVVPSTDPNTMQPVPECTPESNEARCLSATLKTLDILPSGALIFSPKLKKRFGTTNIRLMASQSLARPEFRELAPFAFTDFVGGWNVLGNPNLQPTKIWNAELRMEWFPKPTEVIAITGFFKQFDKPIEQVINANTPATASFINAKAAINAGAELELRKSLGFFAKRESSARQVLRKFSIGSNFAYVYSRVNLRPPCYPPGGMPPMGASNMEEYEEREGCKPSIEAVTSRERPLQGQSPFVLNAFVDYDNPDSGTFVRLMFNTFGRRIYAVGAQGLPDMYEESVPGLDLAFSQRIFAIKNGRYGSLGRELRFELGANNLLNPKIRRTQGKVKASTYEARKGISVSMGLSWSY